MPDRLILKAVPDLTDLTHKIKRSGLLPNIPPRGFSPAQAACLASFMKILPLSRFVKYFRVLFFSFFRVFALGYIPAGYYFLLIPSRRALSKKAFNGSLKFLSRSIRFFDFLSYNLVIISGFVKGKFKK
jgi:hypothetical protein